MCALIYKRGVFIRVCAFKSTHVGCRCLCGNLNVVYVSQGSGCSTVFFTEIWFFFKCWRIVFLDVVEVVNRINDISYIQRFQIYITKIRKVIVSNIGIINGWFFFYLLVIMILFDIRFINLLPLFLIRDSYTYMRELFTLIISWLYLVKYYKIITYLIKKNFYVQ